MQVLSWSPAAKLVANRFHVVRSAAITYTPNTLQLIASQGTPASRVPLSTFRLTTEGTMVPDAAERPLQLSFDDLTA